MKKRLHLFFIILVILFISSLRRSTWQAQGSSAANDKGLMLSPQDKVGAGVWDQLQNEGKAAVVIALVPPTAIHLPALRSEIDQLQARVLASVNTADFTASHLYDAVPPAYSLFLSFIQH